MLLPVHSAWAAAIAVLQTSAFDGNEVVAAIVGAVLGTVGGAVVSHLSSRSSSETARANLTENLRSLNADYAKLKEEEGRLREEVARLQPLSERYVTVRQALQDSSVVREYYQPVLLIGPRGIGKTSLLMQWHAPWDHRSLQASATASTSIVPIHDFVEADAEPHFADHTVRTSVHAHLFLKVFDFPGELSSQRNVREVAVEETKQLNSSGKRDLGIVLICMFNAEEGRSGVSRETRDYYNAEMFRELFNLIMQGSVVIERIVLVFNRYDILRDQVGHEVPDDVLLAECIEQFESVYSPLFNLCNRERVCATFTVLSREDMKQKNRGAPIVLGEAARAFVSAFAGEEAAGELVRPRAIPIPGIYAARA